MFNEKIKKQIYAIATLSGTIIGVGIFSLPYVAVKSGLLLMIGYLAVITFIIILVHLIFGEVALRTPDFLRLPGYAKIHLGNWAKWVAVASAIIGSFGTILAYVVIGGQFLANLLSLAFDVNVFFCTILYFIIGAAFIFYGIKAIAKVEFWGMVVFFIALLLVFWQGLPFLKISNLSLGHWSLGLGASFLPYGVLIFSLWGATMIPELEEMFVGDKKPIKKTIIIGTLISAVCYLFFILLVVALSGSKTSSEAVSGLKNILGSGAISLMSLAGLMATFTSYIAVGLNLKRIFCYDIKIEEKPAWAITCFVPLLLFLFGLNSFIGIIGFIGAVMLAIDGMIILLMYRKIGGKKYVFYPLMAIFVAGIIYEIVYFIK